MISHFYATLFKNISDNSFLNFFFKQHKAKKNKSVRIHEPQRELHQPFVPPKS